MEENLKNSELTNTCAKKAQNGIAKYIIAMIVCVIPVLLFWISTAVLDAITWLLLIPFVTLFVFFYLSIFIAAANPAFILFSLISFVLVIPLGFIMSFASNAAAIIRTAFPVIYLLIMAFPLALTVKGKLFSFKQNTVGSIIALALTMIYIIAAALWETFMLLWGMTNILTSAINLSASIAIASGLFLFVLMIFGAIKAGKKKNAKTQPEITE